MHGESPYEACWGWLGNGTPETVLVNVRQPAGHVVPAPAASTAPATVSQWMKSGVTTFDIDVPKEAPKPK
jgi:hypothetical protein